MLNKNKLYVNRYYRHINSLDTDIYIRNVVAETNDYIELRVDFVNKRRTRLLEHNAIIKISRSDLGLWRILTS